MDPEFETIKRAIIKRHLEQLQRHELVEDPFEIVQNFTAKDDLVTWTNESKKQIDQGKANGVYGGPIGSPINFNNAFMAFMESAAVYLRDTSDLIGAVNLFQTGYDEEEAIRLMEDSTRQISQLADLWGMYFVQICDLVSGHPDGHRKLVGPYCGLFIPKDYKTSDKPYLGVAFKGTNLLSKEILNDLWAMFTTRAEDHLWNSQVAEGFYYPLVSTYYDTASLIPFNMVRLAIHDITKASANSASVHMTGHSLGGAYATLTYAELSITGVDSDKAILGDLYTFGGPRVGRADFVEQLKAAVDSSKGCNGSNWRIVNKNDYVPQLPASPPWSSDPFIHIDSAYMIYSSQPPIPIASEIGTKPWWSLPRSIGAHFTENYYKSLTYATTRRAPAHSVATWGILPPPHSTHPSDLSILTSGILTLQVTDHVWDNNKSADSFILQNRGDYVVGKLQYGFFTAVITAFGNVEANLVAINHFKYNSMQKVFGDENQVVFKKETESQLGLYFLVNDVAVAYASVETKDSNDHGVSDGTLTKGLCLWRFDET